MDSENQDSQWSRPKPEKLAKPTWWPAALAFGATLLVWGLIASCVILICGALVTAISLTGWIGDIRHEHRER
jgi:hypothetical protein